MGSECIAPAFLTSALDGGGLSASRPGRFTPGETALATRYIGGLVGPRASTCNRTPAARSSSLLVSSVFSDYETVRYIGGRSKACTIFARADAGTVGSNSTLGMYV
jgi:hypothetical protein